MTLLSSSVAFILTVILRILLKTQKLEPPWEVRKIGDFTVNVSVSCSLIETQQTGFQLVGYK